MLPISNGFFKNSLLVIDISPLFPLCSLGLLLSCEPWIMRKILGGVSCWGHMWVTSNCRCYCKDSSTWQKTEGPSCHGKLLPAPKMLHGLLANDSELNTYCQIGFLLCVCAQPCATLCDPTDCSPPGSSVHGDFPGKNTGAGCHLLLPGSSRLRDWTCVSCISHTGRQILYH